MKKFYQMAALSALCLFSTKVWAAGYQLKDDFFHIFSPKKEPPLNKAVGEIEITPRGIILKVFKTRKFLNIHQELPDFNRGHVYGQ